MRTQIELDNETAKELAGSGDAVLKALERDLEADVFLRGNVITLEGAESAVAAAEQVVREMADLVRQGHQISEGTITAVTGALDAHESPARVLEDVVWRHRSLKVAPKSVTQKRYVDSIRKNTVTFGIGPAGTGKTWLAVAMAAAALQRREVNRIILTRPAVEAGERLGFLPGDLMAKVDPYLRPLFDALQDMLDPEKVAHHLERGAIEVAPLAYMRGRAQPVDEPVLTPDGFKPVGDLGVGDLVVGSDGCPTPILGVYPQGRKEVFRVTTQDGGSTRACAEHLWFVRTPDDRSHGKAGRVVQTRDMIGRLRRGHVHRFELPVVAPVAMPDRPVTMDPYALGLLLGDGCRTEAPGAAGGVLVESPVRTRSVPAEYLCNSVEVRHAVLQGLLDSDGVDSDHLREDVIYLVRSLGGVAYANGDGLDIRLPDGGGRPMRFVESIEPAGEAECVCIAVGAQDSLYVADDFVVTHNTLNDSFIILDEAQNTSPEQMKMFLTRLGFGSKMVVTGDITQVDLPRDQHSGLIVVSEILQGVEGIDFVRFGRADVVRHKLVQRIVDAYESHDSGQTTELRRA